MSDIKCYQCGLKLIGYTDFWEESENGLICFNCILKNRDKLRADLEVANKENNMLNRIIRLMAEDVTLDRQIKEYDSNTHQEIYETTDEIIERFRTEAEKVGEQGE